MNNEEKILEVLTQMQAAQAQMQEDIAGMKGDISTLKDGQVQMQEDIAGMKGDISDLKGGQIQMQEDIHRINARLDFDVEKRFDAVNEGIDAILEKLTPKSRVDELEADVIVLKTAVKALSQEVAELKKAQ